MVINSRAGYFRRSKLGFHKKAGNLNSLLSKLDGYDQVLVLDADFVARPEILYELAAYSASDVGIIQSPQHFRLDSEVYKRSKFEYGAGLIQRDFYRITQPARQRFGGSICVGTNALYNVQALKDVGGFEGVGRKEWGHSEDVHTGLKMINTLNSKKQRYHIQYVPIQLAQGTCPADHLSFYKQQNRWATGSMQLIFSKKTLFSRRLSFFQKICYFSNSVYYFYTISLLFAPVQLLLLLLANTQYDWSYTLLFIPMLLLSNFAVPIILRRPIKPIATTLVVLSNAYTFAQALFLLFIRKPLGWEATGAGGKKKRNLQFSLFKIFCSGFFLAIYLLTLAVLILNQRIGFNPSTFIIIVFLSAFIAHMVYLHYMLSADIIFKKLYVSRHAYAYVIIFGATILTIFASVYYSGSYGFGVKKDSSIGLYQK